MFDIPTCTIDDHQRALLCFYRTPPDKNGREPTEMCVAKATAHADYLKIVSIASWRFEGIYLQSSIDAKRYSR